MRKIMFATALSAAILIAVSVSAAVAVDEVTDPSPSQTNGYAPDNPSAPSLSGSTAIGECVADAPWISYSVQLNDPDNQITTTTATLHIESGGNTWSQKLGDLVDGKLSGKILWPGADVDGAGVGNNWPGWEQIDGQWAQTDENFGWTRGEVTAYIHVNASMTVPLSYPASTADCLVNPPGENALPLSLPLTGMNAAVLPLGIAGGAVALIGVGLLAAQRRRRSRA